MFAHKRNTRGEERRGNEVVIELAEKNDRAPPSVTVHTSIPHTRSYKFILFM